MNGIACKPCDLMDDIVSLRKYLHQHPEISNNEHSTSAHIDGFMEQYLPDRVIPLAGTGKAFVFDSGQNGPVVIFRAELDALPIQEVNDLDYASVNPGVAHVCGHDGHMAILAGLAQKISRGRPQKGKAVLLFQPAEEVEQGAAEVMKDPGFREIEPDYIFALHNIPGAAMHQVLLKTGSFAAASRGMTIRLMGRTSHAGEPEKGINPANAVSVIIRRLKQLNEDPSRFLDMAFSTIIHILLGEVSFGTSPGYAEIRVTLRAFENRDMDLITEEAERIAGETAREENLGHEISYSEIFPATMNDESCVALIRQAAEAHHLQVIYPDRPFRWSEDFGYYTEKYNGGYFGLGSGENQPALHNPDFDFPDELIATGINLFYTIYRKVIFEQ
jgi:amidohydrolase